MPHDPIQAALAHLVYLKDLKERIEAGTASNIERGEYSFLKEAAWENARAALAAPAAPKEQPSDEDLMRVFREACEHADHCNQGFSYGRAQALRAVFNLARYGAVPQPGEDAQPVAWRGAQQIADLPAVHEALEAFSHDSTEDNAVGLVQAVLEASPQPAPRAAPQVREDAQPVAWLYRGTHHGIALELNRIDNFYAHPKGGYIKGEPLYITPQPAGRDAREAPDEP